MADQTPTKLQNFFDWCKNRNVVAPFATIWIRTQPKLLAAAKIPFPLGVERLSQRAVQLGCSYENCVRNKLEIPDFRAEALWNGKGRHTPGNRYLVEHVDKPGQYYLAFKPREKNSVLEDQWTDLATKTIISEPVEYFQKKSPSKTGVEWRVVMIENVEQIKCDQFFDIAGGK